MVYYPNKAIHVGYTISRILEKEGLTQKNLADRTGLTEKHLSNIINGDASVTVETALLLENALGGSASYWLNLEKNYQETKARIERISQMKEEAHLLSKFPYNEIAKRGYVEQTTNKEKRVENLWKFFAVNSLLSIQKTVAIAFQKNITAVAFRRDGDVKIKSEHIAAWLRCGEIELKSQVLPEYSESTLKKSLTEIKALSKKSPEQFSKELVEILNKSGVGIVYIPHFPGTGVSSAFRWIGNNPLIQLSIRYPWADIFWFNLFHEIGHLLIHGKKGKFIKFDKQDVSLVDEEKEADEFATNELINKDKYLEFLKTPLSLDGIVDFSNNLGIDKGVVAGRLCYDEKLNWKDAAKLRTRLTMKD